MKFVAGEAFIVNAEKEEVKLSSVIYVNVLNSTGSIIPLIWDSIKNNYELNLYGENMTRFMIDVEKAVDCIEEALNHTGVNIVPNIKSFAVKDLFEIYSEKFDLKWKLGQPRISEKIHEHMFSPYEIPRTTYIKDNDIYLIHYRNIYNELNITRDGLSSEDCLVSKAELDNLLKTQLF